MSHVSIVPDQVPQNLEATCISRNQSSIYRLLDRVPAEPDVHSPRPHTTSIARFRDATDQPIHHARVDPLRRPPSDAPTVSMQGATADQIKLHAQISRSSGVAGRIFIRSAGVMGVVGLGRVEGLR